LYITLLESVKRLLLQLGWFRERWMRLQHPHVTELNDQVVNHVVNLPVEPFRAETISLSHDWECQCGEGKSEDANGESGDTKQELHQRLRKRSECVSA
jgi:hypothetical protein